MESGCVLNPSPSLSSCNALGNLFTLSQPQDAGKWIHKMCLQPDGPRKALAPEPSQRFAIHTGYFSSYNSLQSVDGAPLHRSFQKHLLQAKHWHRALLWFHLFQKLPTFQILFFLACSTFSSLVVDLFTIQCLRVQNLYLWALPPLAQVGSMKYAPKLPVKTQLTTACMCVCTHTHKPSRYTSETCQQVIIFPADGSELLGAFQLCSLFKLHFPSSLQLLLTPGALGQQTRSALSSLASSCPYKELLPWAIQFPEQTCNRLYNPAQARSRKQSFYKVSPTVILLICILLAKQCLSRQWGYFYPGCHLVGVAGDEPWACVLSSDVGSDSLVSFVTYGVLPDPLISTLCCSPCMDEHSWWVGGRRGHVAGIPGKRGLFQCALPEGTVEKGQARGGG